jgi:hypothetical protein
MFFIQMRILGMSAVSLPRDVTAAQRGVQGHQNRCSAAVLTFFVRALVQEQGERRDAKRN